MDPHVALLTGLSIRGADAGYLFCDARQNKQGICKIDPNRPLSSARFATMMRSRLSSIGIGPSDVLMYSGHSLKRGAIQLYRSLGLKDEYIMQRVQMVGARAYSNYCEAYNDCAPRELPRFAYSEQFLEHAVAVMHDRKVLFTAEQFDRILSKIEEY